MFCWLFTSCQFSHGSAADIYEPMTTMRGSPSKYGHDGGQMVQIPAFIFLRLMPNDEKCALRSVSYTRMGYARFLFVASEDSNSFTIMATS